MQVNCFATIFQVVAVALKQNGATACGNNAVSALCQLFNDFLFNNSKSWLPAALKKLADRAADTVLYREI